MTEAWEGVMLRRDTTRLSRQDDKILCERNMGSPPLPTRKHLWRLDSDAWLNDEIVNTSYQLMQVSLIPSI